jgi:hypothetical protein
VILATPLGVTKPAKLTFFDFSLNLVPGNICGAATPLTYAFPWMTRRAYSARSKKFSTARMR